MTPFTILYAVFDRNDGDSRTREGTDGPGGLGSESLVDRMRRGLDDLKENPDVRRESTQHRHLSSWHSLEGVTKAVREAYGTSRKALLRRHNCGCEARQVLLYLAATHCRGRYSPAELGQALGPVSLAAVSQARFKMVNRMANDAKLRKRGERVSESLTGKADKVKIED